MNGHVIWHCAALCAAVAALLSLGCASPAAAQATVTEAELAAFNAAVDQYQKTGDAAQVLQLARLYCQRGVPNICEFVAPMEAAIAEEAALKRQAAAPRPAAPRPALAPVQSAPPPQIFRRNSAALGQPSRARPSPRILPPQSQGRTTIIPIPGAVAPADTSRVIAGNGQSAMACTQLITLSKGDPRLQGGGRIIANNCGTAVEITWCYVDTECSRDSGNMWTVGTGRSWPVSAVREIRWAACIGANTVSFEKGTAGGRFICTAPLGGPQPQVKPGAPLNSRSN